MADKSTIYLQITQADGTQKSVSVDAAQTILGAGAGAEVNITDPKASDLHVMLKIDSKGGLTALDLGSASGTKLGEKRLTEPTTLTPGDVLEVGSTKVRVSLNPFTDPDNKKAEEKKAEEKKAEEKKAEEKKAEEKKAEEKKAEEKKAEEKKAEEKKAEEKKAEEKKAEEKKAEEKKAEEKKGKKAKKSASKARAVGSIGATALLFNEELSAEETPSDTSKILEVAQLWGDTLINIRQFGERGEVRVGSDRANDFQAFETILGESTMLARADGKDLSVTVPDGSDVILRNAQSQKSLEQLAGEGALKATDGATRGKALKLGLHDRALITIGAVSFVVRWVRPHQHVGLEATGPLDFYFSKVLSITFMAFIVLWWAIRFTDLGMSSLSDDLFRNADKYAKMLIVPPAKKEVKKLLSGVAEGAKAKKEEGKFGKKEAKKEDADPSKKGAPKLDPNKREEDRLKVAKSGLLAAFGKMDDSAVSNVLGPGGLGTGINNALGGLKGGAGVGDAHGVGGLGSRGTGPGGGGNGLGLGGLGTKGGGRGAGGYGSLDLGGKGKDTVRVIPGKTTVVGSLSREEIERVIKRHQNEILFCYNTELSKDPNLAGKVAVNFTIDGSGSVADASSSQNTTNNNNMEQCMLSRIRRWKFPEPKGGGVVVVTYPWIFNAAGGDE